MKISQLNKTRSLKSDRAWIAPGIPGRSALSAAVSASCLLLASSATHGIDLKLEDGWSGSLATTVSLGTSVRNQSPDPLLYSLGNGVRAGLGNQGLGGSNTDSGNVNYAKGDAFSTLVRVNSELSLQKGDSGFFARARGWYDYALSKSGVLQGNGGSGYSRNAPLSDAGFDTLGRFSGVALLDAYAYTSINLGDRVLQLRLGNQVINWGESLFIQGINQVNPIDLSALRKPGTELKDAFLPVGALSANLSLGGGRALEAFYQYKWRAANIDSCGTYWSPVEFQLTHKAGNPCSTVLTTFWPPNSNTALPIPIGVPIPLSNAEAIAAGTFVPMAQGRAGDDSGQFGLALRLPAGKLDAEFGLFAMQFSSRIPLVSGRSGSNLGLLTGPIGSAVNAAGLLNPIPAQVTGARALGLALQPGVGFWEYPDKIRTFGVSTATNLGGWSLGAEVSHTPNQPAQINANDLLAALLRGAGPMGAVARQANAQGAGTEVSGYDRIRKNQVQVNGIRIIPRVLGSAQGTLVAEAGFQFADVGDSFTGKRYGRAFIFGTARHALYGGANVPCTAQQALAAGLPVTATVGNPQPDGCQNDGFVTKNSWGYRLRMQLEYPGIFGTPVTFFPSLSLAHDVKGYSVDTQFIEGRRTIGLGGRFSLNRVHNLELNWVHYADSAKYDPFRDRDYYSIVVSTSF